MIPPEDLRCLVGAVTHPAHFFVGQTIGLQWEYAFREEVYWELYQGQLLDASQTRTRQAFEAWNIYQRDRSGRSSEPLLSLKLDLAGQLLHITRGIQCYAWEGYHAGDNVYLSRETRKWVRELVGTIDLNRFPGVDDLRAELVGRLFQAVVGVSRLPLTSLQAPLPVFTLGELAYVYQPHADLHAAEIHPLRSHADLLDRGLTADLGWLEKTKLLETLLRATPRDDLPGAAELLKSRWTALGLSRPQLLDLFRSLFAEVALSPYTDFVEKTLVFLWLLVERDFLSPADLVDFLSYLLRQLGRHLTAYDLVTFHHFGANYPDALLLDEALKMYLDLIEQYPSLFISISSPVDEQPTRLRRRALRQGWLLRRNYEGHPVPDAPTSPGENARVLPPPHPRVPEEQIVNPARRTRHLFANDPLPAYLGEHGREVLRESIQDLILPSEQKELGLALFVDRPFGVGKAPGEPDQTLLLSYEAFSRRIAGRRLDELEQSRDFSIEPPLIEACRASLQSRLRVRGVALEKRAQSTRPEPVSLDDALKVADDFLLLRTTRRAVADFLDQYDFTILAKRYPLDFLTSGRPVLIVRSASSLGAVLVYDDVPRKRLEFHVDPRQGYACCGDREVPVAGLRVLRVWVPKGTDEDYQEIDLHAQEVVILPRMRKARG